MSAASLGERLLGEVKEECLDELLHSLRTHHSLQQTSKIGIPPLDRLLNLFLHPPPREPPSYTQFDSTQPNPGFNTSKKSKSPVIEITSAAPCAGKRQLLYYIAATAVLPQIYNGMHTGAREGAVVVLDTDNQFNVIRLRDVLSSCIRDRLETTTLAPPDLDSLLQTSLQNVHMFRPQSPPSLLSTLQSLRAHLFNTSTHFSSPRPLSTLILTNLSTFLWQTRLDADEAPPSDAKNPNPFVQYYRSLVQELSLIQRTFDCVIVAANQGLTPLQWTRKGEVSLRPPMPAVWNEFCALKLIVGRDGVRKFGPGISAEEAVREREMRRKALEESGFWGRVNWWGSGEWELGVAEGLRALPGGGSFSFRVMREGIKMG